MANMYNNKSCQTHFEKLYVILFFSLYMANAYNNKSYTKLTQRSKEWCKAFGFFIICVYRLITAISTDKQSYLESSKSHTNI